MDAAPLQTTLVRCPLDAAGLSPDVLSRYRKLLGDAHRALDDGNVPKDARREWIIPGRVEVLGKHVDYAGGRSLLCTVERGIALVARPHAQRSLVVRDARRREAISISFAESMHGSLPWAVYPRTVVRRLVHNFGDVLQGCDLSLASNLPSASGLSSSSALTVGLTVALAALADLPSRAEWSASIPDRVHLAGYVGALENGADYGALLGERGVGTMGGAQDQTAILCCGSGQLDVFGWAPVQHEETVPWPAEYVFVIGVSGVVAAKTGAARDRYNRVARTAHRLVAAWNASGGGTARTLREAFVEAAAGTAITGVPDALLAAAYAGADDEFSAATLAARLTQFYDEVFTYVPGAARALANGELGAFGDVVAASQAGAERALGNQIPATTALVALANELGAVAASAFGAGFGGSVWAMVRRDEAERFTSVWRDRFSRGRTGQLGRTHFFVTAPSVPAFEVAAD